jgi:hypothetical protein
VREWLAANDPDSSSTVAARNQAAHDTYVAAARKALLGFYQRANPAKRSNVDAIVATYLGMVDDRSEELIARLRHRYGFAPQLPSR